MIKLLIWIFIAYGCTNILVYGSIFSGFKNFLGRIRIPVISNISTFVLQLLSCVMCTSTWVGFFLSFVLFSPYISYIDEYRHFGSGIDSIMKESLAVFVDGLFASGSVWALNSVIEWFEENKK